MGLLGLFHRTVRGREMSSGVRLLWICSWHYRLMVLSWVRILDLSEPWFLYWQSRGKTLSHLRLRKISGANTSEGPSPVRNTQQALNKHELAPTLHQHSSGESRVFWECPPPLSSAHCCPSGCWTVSCRACHLSEPACFLDVAQCLASKGIM